MQRTSTFKKKVFIIITNMAKSHMNNLYPGVMKFTILVDPGGSLANNFLYLIYAQE